MKPIQRILVPTDFSEGSEAAADLTLQLAKQLDAAVELLTVVDTSPLLEAYGDMAFRNERITEIRSHAERQLEHFAQKHFASLNQVQLHIGDGNILLEILKAAEDTASDMIVMGTHGRTGLAHLLIGSITEKVVRKSPIPVVTVRQKKA